MSASLGSRIKRLRVSLGLSQGALSKLVGAGRTATVSAWENDKAKPDRGKLRLLADLTSDASTVFVWLEHDGPAPAKIERGTGGLSGGVQAGNQVGSPVVNLPTIPEMALDDPVRVRELFGEYVKRWTTMASSGGSIPAYAMLEGAVMLMKLYEQYSHVLFRLNAVLSELPLVIFELDAEDKLVGYHAGGRQELELPSDVYMGKMMTDVMPLLAATKFADVLAEVREHGVQRVSGHAVPFKDKDRSYHATLSLLPDRHVLVFVLRAEETRKKELGLGGKRRRGKVALSMLVPMLLGISWDVLTVIS